jgi:glycosyltransferase involved in cell wall biosynthesis
VSGSPYTPIIVANPLRSPSDNHARVFHSHGLLAKYCMAVRNHPEGIPAAYVERIPALFLPEYAAAKIFRSPYLQEMARFGTAPLFDRWLHRRLISGCHMLAGLGYVNQSLQRIKEMGGLVFLDARNSHPSSFWSLVAEEHARWGCSLPPIWPKHHMRQQASVALADYIFVPSRFVERSFLDHGVSADRLLRLPYPVDLNVFQPASEPRHRNRTLTVVSSGLLTLRKGAPYLFQAFRQIRKQVPNARFKLIRGMADSFRDVYDGERFSDVPVEWADRMPHDRLAAWLRDADIYLLPTIEEGMVRTVVEALASGLFVVTTPNAGADDYIQDGLNGRVVPIRSAQAAADAVLEAWESMQREGAARPPAIQRNDMGIESFEKRLLHHLAIISRGEKAS